MASVREHLHGGHEFNYQDRTDAIDNCNAALDKVAAMEPTGGPITTFLKAEIARHTLAKAHHASGMEECDKSASDDLDKVTPTRVSSIAPARPTITAIPRFGS